MKTNKNQIQLLLVLLLLIISGCTSSYGSSVPFNKGNNKRVEILAYESHDTRGRSNTKFTFISVDNHQYLVVTGYRESSIIHLESCANHGN